MIHANHAKKTVFAFHGRNALVFAAALLVLLPGSCKKSEAGSAGQTEAAPAVITITAATAGSPRPFTYVDETGKLVGHNIEMIEAVFARLPQYKLVFDVTDFPSIFSGLDAGRYQIGVNNFVSTEQRREKYLFTEPMFKNRHVIAVAENSGFLGNQVNSLSDLAGKSVIVTVGTIMATVLENHNNNHPEALIKLIYSDANLLLALQQVESGKNDFDLIDRPLLDFYVKEFGLKLKGVELSPNAQGEVMQFPYSFFIVNKGNEKLVEDINKALAGVIADGTSKRICEKYFGSDYSPEAR
jgi:polar amino acid transport system substrate-binding protein